LIFIFWFVSHLHKLGPLWLEFTWLYQFH
jgi:hypothetical protein